ncbi:hypothetical protein DFH06DRAFT_1282850 [Mycena polygramma]|nr:hypothetical protein DFH06DRAFT_1282850 [Mycena polygramma]
MPEYVYALHDFLPEHEDEVSFHTGERIEVVEKDDLYGDGWWRGRNLAGRPSGAPLQSLPEEPESIGASPVSPVPEIYLNDEDTESIVGPNGEVMKATMTDEAARISITMPAASASPPHATARPPMTDEEETTDFDMSEGEGWHKDARAKLAKRARQAVAPPIAVELSDESDAEEDDDHHDDDEEDHYATSPLRDQYIPEEDEPSEPMDGLGRLRSLEEIPATATAHSFPEVPPTPVSPGTPPPPAAAPLPAPALHDSPLRESVTASPGLPSPAPSAAANASKHSSVASSTAGLMTGVPSKPSSVHSAPLSVVSEGKRRDDSGHASGSGGSAHGAPKHPSEWTVEEVVDWLKSKGFDEVSDKFTEQEITGDVLLDLDANLLKTEIGIMAFGKRVRIANAIADLRRPPSPSASFSLAPVYNAQSSPQHPQYANSQPYPNSPHSRTQSQSHSQQSYNGHHSLQSSVGSPLQNGYLAQTYGAAAAGHVSPETAPHTGDIPGMPVDEHGRPHSGGQPIGLGIPMGDQANGARSKGRPAQLTLSPSDGALNVSATQTDPVEGQEDERAVMSESELPHAANASIRKRLFGGRSPTAGSSINECRQGEGQGLSRLLRRDQARGRKGYDKKKESSIATGPGRHARNKKSIDNTNPAKGGERLSIFGASFGGRKPAPRYSGASDEVDKTSSGFTLPRLNRKNGRPSTPGGSAAPQPQLSPGPNPPQPPHSPSNGSHPPPSNNPALLRKRTTSGQTYRCSQGPGQSVLDQIGEADHVGWMRKKGDRYNSWKLRYFVLKGEDMYWLRSSNKAETKIKGYIKIVGYKVTVDENVNPGRYGFRIDHDHDKTHYFSSDEKTVVRDWMKAIMKATIGRDYSKPVVSSCNIPTIPLMVAQAMNPAPRPPSPTARAATQRALRRENTDQPSTRDARVLMLTGFATNDNSVPKEERARLDSFFTNTEASGTGSVPGTPQSSAPPRPTRRMSAAQQAPTPVDDGLIEWANSHLPSNLQITEPTGPLCDGLGLLRLAESIKGKPSSPPVPDSAFPKDSSDDNLDGLFRLFDFLLDNEGKRDKIIQLLRGLKGWEDKRKAIATSIGKGGAQAGGFMAPAWSGV